MKKTESGFTVIEILVAVAILVVIGVFVLVQRNDLIATQNDQARKIAINSMYANLTEIYHKEHKYYPTSIDSKDLTAIDPDLFYDPNGIMINEPDSEYYYEALDCNAEGHCKDFRLTAKMQKEPEYIKSSTD